MARDSRESQIIELKDTVRQLNETVRSLNETIAAANEREEEHLQRERVMQEQIDYLTKKLFGKSSEKRDDVEGQLSLFNEAEAVAVPTSPEEEEFAKSEKPARKKKATMADRFAGLKVEKVYLDVPEGERVCKVCGTPLERIGTEFLRRELEFKRPSLKVIEYYSVTYGCPSCKENAEVPYIVKGRDGHPHMLHGMASAGTVAWVMYQKYVNSLPLYRQERDFKALGAEISRGTIANWIISNATEFFAPLCDYLKRRLVAGRYAMADETPVQVLKEKERRAETKSFMWVFRSGEYDPEQIVLFHYSETRAGETAKDFLDGFTGYLMTDGYGGYNKLKKCTRTSCWAHVRRYLIDAIPAGKQYDYSEPAVQGLAMTDKLFDLERKIHEKKGVTFDAVKQWRLEKEVPVLNAFWDWLDKQKAANGTRMHKALTYVRNRKPYLVTYLEDGGCSFSNNTSERSCKAFVTGRKNWLFADTPEGAAASALVYSVVETAKANNADVYTYLKYLLLKCPTDQTSDEELEKLCPWNPECREALEEMERQRQKEIFAAM